MTLGFRFFYWKIVFNWIKLLEISLLRSSAFPFFLLRPLVQRLQESVIGGQKKSLNRIQFNVDFRVCQTYNGVCWSYQLRFLALL
jgi:hypothetical protein